MKREQIRQMLKTPESRRERNERFWRQFQDQMMDESAGDKTTEPQKEAKDKNANPRH